MATLALWLTSIFHLCLGIIVFKNSDTKARIPFSILTTTLFIWVFIFGYIYIAPSELVLVLTKIVPLPTLLLPVSLAALVHYFPNNTSKVPTIPTILHVLTTIVFLLFWNSPLFISNATVEHGKLLFEFGPIYLACMAYIQGFIIYSFIKFGIKSKQFNPSEKKVSKKVIAGGALTVSTTIIFTTILPAFGIDYLNFMAPIGTIFLAWYWGYAIIKEDYLDTKIIVTKLTSHFIVAAFMTLSFLGANQVLNSSIVTIIVNMGLGLFWAILFKNLVTLIQTPLQKKFLKGYYNTEEILHNLSTQLLYTHSYETVMSVIASEFLNQLELRSAFTFFITDPEEFEIKKVGLAPPLGNIPENSNFIDFFKTQSTPLHIDELPNEVQAELRGYNFEKHSLLFAVHSSKQLKGVFLLSPKLNEEAFSKNDMQLLSTITNQILVVFDRIAKERELKALNESLEQKVADQVKEIEEKQKIEKELQLASQIQERVLPSKVPRIAQYNISANFYPARTVSGDYYDFLVFSEHKIGILIADIVGKGIPASFHMMNLKNLVHQTIREFHSPSEALKELNTEIIRDRVIEKYVPVTYGILDTQAHTFTYSNAGHEPAFFVSKKTVKDLSTGGMPLGMDEHETYEQETLQLNDQDTILLFTDGLFDARNTKDEEFGPDRVVKTIKEHTQNVQDELSLQAKLIQTWKDFQDNEKQQKDDMTLITIEHEKLTFTKPKQIINKKNNVK